MAKYHENEVEELRAQVAWHNAQMRAREVADARKQIEATAAAQKAADERAAAEQREALATEVEAVRRGSYFAHLISTEERREHYVRTCNFDPEKIRADIPPTGWPPGDGPEHHIFVSAPVGRSAPDVGETGSTLIGKMFAEKGIKL